MPTANELIEGDGPDRDRLLEEPIEEQPSVAGATPVEAEGELVRVVVQVLGSDRGLVGPEQPPAGAAR